MPQTITARRLLTPIGSIEYPVITLTADGLIEDISSDPSSHSDSSGGSDSSQDTLTPTFLDIHTHGVAHHDVMEATPQAFSAINHFLATKGVGRYLPTTVTAPVDDILRSLEGIANAIEAPVTPGRAQPIGIHLEGPFISHAKRGVHPPGDIQPPSIELFDRFYAAARGHIRLITIAPETFAPETAATHGNRTALDLIAHCVSLGVRVSLGHSNALKAEALAGVLAGATSATHTFNAMRPLDHREPGILGVTLDHPDLYAEIICDGIHVAPELIRLWLKAKGESRAILVTDSMSATGMPDGTYTLGNLTVQVAHQTCLLVEDGQPTRTLAGSVLTMDRAVANLQHFTGASLATALHLAAHNPATLLGLPIPIAPGQPASFNRFSPQGHLKSTLLHGQTCSRS